MVRWFITESGARLIHVLQKNAPNGDLDVLLTDALRALIYLVVSRKRNNSVVPADQDFFTLSFRSPPLFQGRFFTKTRREDSVAEFEIPMPKEFFEGLTTLRELVTYESEDSAIRHVFLFAYYSELEKRGIGHMH